MGRNLSTKPQHKQVVPAFRVAVVQVEQHPQRFWRLALGRLRAVERHVICPVSEKSLDNASPIEDGKELVLKSGFIGKKRAQATGAATLDEANAG